MVQVGQFAILEFVPADGSDVRPYSQAAREPDGSWYAEVVSDRYLSRFAWPLDTDALRRDGWSLPDAPDGNWWRYADTSDPHEVARILVNGLRFGRRCFGEGSFDVSIGTFPPNPDDGLPVPLPAAEISRAA